MNRQVCSFKSPFPGSVGKGCIINELKNRDSVTLDDMDF